MRAFQRMLDDLIAIAMAHGVGSALTDEPRTYRLTSRGRAALGDAIAAGRARHCTLVTPIGREMHGDAVLYLRLCSPLRTELALDLGATVVPSPGESWPGLASQVTELVSRWFGPLNAGAAFVSVHRPPDSGGVGDQPLVTAHERACHLPPINTWPAVQRFVRGAFWGMGLGSALCARLGGSDRVLHDAPVAIAQPLPPGVWLQLSGAPPADDASLARLAAYLNPVLAWSAEEVLAVQPALPIQRVTVAQSRRRGSAVPAGFSIPVRFQGADERVGGLNLRFAAPASSEQQGVVARAVLEWSAAAFSGEFGGGIHRLDGPSTSEGQDIMRWNVDLGDIDLLAAMAELTDRLAALAVPKVAEVVLGTEEVG